MADVNFVVTVPVSTQLYPGRFIAVRNVSKSAPIPSWVTECAKEFSGPVTDPWLVDAAAVVAEEHAARIAWSAPKVADYRREDLKKLLKLGDNDINELMGHCGMPRPRLVQVTKDFGGAAGEPIGSYESWSGKDMNAYLERVRRLFTPILQ